MRGEDLELIFEDIDFHEKEYQKYFVIEMFENVKFSFRINCVKIASKTCKLRLSVGKE